MISYATPIAHESLTIDATIGGVGCTAATIQNSGTPVQKAFMTLETYAIRFTIDGTAPTTTVGHLAQVGDTINLMNYDQMRKFRAINATGGQSGILKVTYYLDLRIE